MASRLWGSFVKRLLKHKRNIIRKRYAFHALTLSPRFDYSLEQSAFTAFNGPMPVPNDHVVWQSALGIPPDIWDKKGITIPLSDGEYWKVILAPIEERSPEILEKLEEVYPDIFEAGAKLLSVIKRGLTALEPDNCVKEVLRRKVVRLDDPKCVKVLGEALKDEVESELKKLLEESKAEVTQDELKVLAQRIARKFAFKTKEFADQKVVSGYVPWLALREEDGSLELLLLSEDLQWGRERTPSPPPPAEGRTVRG